VKGHDPGATVFLRDNIVVTATRSPLPMADDRVVQKPADVPAAQPWESAGRALFSAGSRPARHDPIDARIIATIIRGDGRIIDSQEQVGGYPVRAATRREVVVPEKDRERWLDALSKELAVDKGLDLSPLWERLKRF
jgi:hypothetical protein